jgi:archaellum component FlaC
MSNIENLVLEHLKKMQAEMTGIRQDTAEIKSRLGSIESGIGRIAQGEASNYAEIIENRHMFDRLAERVERLEKRLELAS